MKQVSSTAPEYVGYGLDPGRTVDDQTTAFRVHAPAVPSVWSASYFSLILCIGLSGVLAVFYLIAIKQYVFLPADILIWAETNFVGDMIKLRIGAPLYGPPEDSNSMIYTPGSTLLTYAISWIIGMPTSIPAWRVIQLCFSTGAAIMATVCANVLRKLAYPDHRNEFPRTWIITTFLAMFLAVTAPYSNRFAYALHADALALLVSMFCFWTVLQYVRSPNWSHIILMAICPALGYLTKQILISWIAVMFIFLLLHNPRDIKRLGLFVGVSIGFFAAAVGACYWLWGDAFIFWTFEITGGSRRKIGFTTDGFNLSLVRGLDHTLRVWMEIALGVMGGWLILRGKDSIRRLGPLWIAWLALIASEALSSSAGWSALYHFGPGIVIGAIWLFAALPRFWPRVRGAASSPTTDFPRVVHWVRCLVAVSAMLTVFVALRVVPTAANAERRSWHALQTTPDVYRYIADIEREFEGLPPQSVLLDVGNWIYLRHSVLVKDRAVSLADQPPGGIYRNMDVMVSRIRKKEYAKILVRNFDSPNFFYDWSAWERPSGVRQALQEYYVVLHTIPRPQGGPSFFREVTQTGPISVLVPRPESPNSSSQR